MRRSQQGLRGIKKDNYPGLPEDLKEYNYYYQDCGHVIMAIPKCLMVFAETNGDLDMYECPFPCKYVVTKGYQIYKDHVVCDAHYDEVFGLDIDEKWFEF